MGRTYLPLYYPAVYRVTPRMHLRLPFIVPLGYYSRYVVFRPWFMYKFIEGCILIQLAHAKRFKVQITRITLTRA